MYETVECQYLQTGDTVYVSLELPRTCPHCNAGYAGKTTSASALNLDSNVIAASHFCPACSEYFFAIYCSFSPNERFQLRRIYPTANFKPTTFSDRLSNISPKFVEVYNQASRAEHEGLNEICGISYRRAEEFLVKDFAKHLYPDKAEEIIKSSLSQCISKYIENSNVKEMAKRTTWLGNDHAHYVSKHPDQDLSDLKALLSLTIKWIDMELETAEYIKALP